LPPVNCPLQDRLTCAGTRCRWRQVAAFTLVELLVVIAIIALLTAVSLPALKGFGKGTGMAGAQRQLLQDLGLARLSAINGRTAVYMVFVPTNILQVFGKPTDPKVLRQLTNLVSGQYTAYALVTKRSVGDQPGQERPRYISEWKWLPQGILIETNKYSQWNPYLATYPLDYRRPFSTNVFLFPSSKGIPWTLPCVAFNSQGQLVSGRDELIPLAEGSIFFNAGVPDVVMKPPYNYTNHFIRINWLTGRASVDEATRPKFY